MYKVGDIIKYVRYQRSKEKEFFGKVVQIDHSQSGYVYRVESLFNSTHYFWVDESYITEKCSIKETAVIKVNSLY